MSIDWDNTLAAIWRPLSGKLRAVKHLDPVQLEDLLGIEAQKAGLLENTRRFVAGLPANNALLWGSRGTGKSSLIKAVLNHFTSQGLRLIEVDPEDLRNLPDIVDGIRDLEYRFIIFCDDFSFDGNERYFKSLKSILEGSIEQPPENVLLYATSNRRHLVPEYMQDNLDSRLEDKEVHLSDAIEERISLSDRFGLWLPFYPISTEDYLTIVDHLFRDSKADPEVLHQQALDYSRVRAARSGRTARQFFNAFSARTDSSQAGTARIEFAD